MLSFRAHVRIIYLPVLINTVSLGHIINIAMSIRIFLDKTYEETDDDYGFTLTPFIKNDYYRYACAQQHEG